jgi:hypothetical protein
MAVLTCRGTSIALRSVCRSLQIFLTIVYPDLESSSVLDRRWSNGVVKRAVLSIIVAIRNQHSASLAISLDSVECLTHPWEIALQRHRDVWFHATKCGLEKASAMEVGLSIANEETSVVGTNRQWRIACNHPSCRNHRAYPCRWCWADPALNPVRSRKRGKSRWLWCHHHPLGLLHQ